MTYDPSEDVKRVAAELRSRRAARLAGPNAALWRALYRVQQPTRKPTLASLIRQAKKAGATMIERDGVKVTLVEPTPDDAPLDAWLTKRGRDAH
jgi:hypothetical protein